MTINPISAGVSARIQVEESNREPVKESSEQIPEQAEQQQSSPDAEKRPNDLAVA